jgi:hypothetical protein
MQMLLFIERMLTVFEDAVNQYFLSADINEEIDIATLEMYEDK